MIKTVIGDTLTVGELIEELKNYPKDMPLCTGGYYNIMDLKRVIWEHSNYPYDLPNTEFIMIE